MTLHVYLAGRFNRRAELAQYASDLTHVGITVTSRWLSGAHDKELTLTEDDGRRLARQYAREDLEDIRKADLLVAFTEDQSIGYTSGGRHCEYGIALERGIPIILVGPGVENVFGWLAKHVVSDWGEALPLIYAEDRKRLLVSQADVMERVA